MKDVYGDDIKKTKILIIDDHPIVCQGLSQLINSEDDLEVCGTAPDAAEAMKVIAKTNPEVVIVDISLRDISGIELIKNLKVRQPNVLSLVVSMHDESLYAERALKSGARGYVMKSEATEKVITAIRQILSGMIYVSSKITEKILRNIAEGRATDIASGPGSLSDRELEIFHFIGQGLSTRDISDRLHLSSKTVDTYRSRIKDKLGLKSSFELFQYAIHWLDEESL